MKRTEYKDYIIDTDNLGRPYVYSKASSYSEDADHVLVFIDGRKKELQQVKAIIDAWIDGGHGLDPTHACFAPDGSIYVF